MKLGEVQKQMDREEKKLIRDVVTRWNSHTTCMKAEQYKAINAALCFMDCSELCLSSAEMGR